MGTRFVFAAHLRRHRSQAIVSAAALCVLLSTAIESARSGQPTIDPEAQAIAVEAYIYLYPLVTMDVSRRRLTNSEPGKKAQRAPMNRFNHSRTFPDVDFRAVVRPNFDTLYSTAWIDVSAEPMIVSAPDTGGRYYLLPMLDMWTDVFASPGKRTTGTGPVDFAVVGAGWKGTLPERVQRIDAPTPHVWILGRTQTNGPKDYDAVHKVQDGYKLTRLSQWGKEPTPLPVTFDPSVDMKTPPLDQVNNMKAAEFFRYAAELLKLHPPHITDQPIAARMKRIGLESGKSFDLDKADAPVRKIFEAAPAAGLKALRARTPTVARVVNGWQLNIDTMGVYGNYYLKRAIVAMIALGANLPEDTVYPLCLADSAGKPLDGSGKYVLHFGKEELPPVEAFWSVTMYDAQGFQSANRLNRFAIGDRDALKFNADGSLDLYLQHKSPGADKEANWLPAPKGPLGVTMRLYAPRAEVLEGRWAPPAMKRSE